MSETWNEATIETVKKKGGKEILLRNIYAGMENHPLVTPFHKEVWRSDKQQPRYQNQIRRCLTTLTNNGTLIRVSKGKYSLKDKANSK